MLHLSLLEVSDETTELVKWISLGAALLMLCVIALICLKGKGGKYRYDAKHIAFAGVTIGLSFALSYAKISPVPYGGSITLASFVPVLIYAYVYGLTDGLLVGLVFGLLNFVSGPYILTPMTFVLDYLLAFASIGFMGIAHKFTKKITFNVVLGTVGVFAIRFVFHLISGVIYFAQDAIWVDFPDWALVNSFVYSFIYQCVYIPADCAIATVVLYILAKTRVLERLIQVIKPRERKSVEETAVVEETAQSETPETAEEVAAAAQTDETPAPEEKE